MKFFILIFLMLSSLSFQDNYLDIIKFEIEKVESLLIPPSDFLTHKDSSYFADQLIKITFDNNCKMVLMEASDDSVTSWFKTAIDKIWKSKRVNIKKIESVAKNENLKSCSIVFPVVIYVESFLDRHKNDIVFKGRNKPLNENFYNFNEKKLAGKIIFGAGVVYRFSHVGTNMNNSGSSILR